MFAKVFWSAWTVASRNFSFLQPNFCHSKGKGSSWPLEWHQLEVFTYEPVRTQAAAGGIQAAFRSARSRFDPFALPLP